MSHVDEVAIEVLSSVNRTAAKQFVLQLLMELDNKAIDETVYESSIHEFFDNTKSVVYVAKHNDKYIGVLTAVESIAIYSQGAYGVIQELFVLPEARSLAVGEHLMDAMKQHAKNKGWRRLEVTTPNPTDWPRTVAFYKRHGFEEIGFRMKWMIHT